MCKKPEKSLYTHKVVGENESAYHRLDHGKSKNQQRSKEISTFAVNIWFERPSCNDSTMIHRNIDRSPGLRHALQAGYEQRTIDRSIRSDLIAIDKSTIVRAVKGVFPTLFPREMQTTDCSYRLMRRGKIRIFGVFCSGTYITVIL